MREVVIVEAVRTPMGRKQGVLSGIHPNDLGALVLNEVVKRAGIESSMVEDVVFGCVDEVGEPHPALQGGRIVSVHASGACGVPVAFIDFSESPRSS